MNKLKYVIPGRILKTLYCTLIQPYLSYGILIWGSTCKSYLDKLVKLQNGQYARFVVVIIEAILDIYLQNVIF